MSVRLNSTVVLVALALALAGCGRKPVKPPPPEPDYTPGGLYKPGVPDGAPEGVLDFEAIPEPVPRAEPLARYGNRSPYTVLGRSYHVLGSAEGYLERGIASWYGTKFHGRATSSLEPYDMYKYTAAHRTLPLPTYVRVTNLDNGRSVVVRVNDRGPFHSDRLIDLSYIAAAKLGMLEAGTAPVEVRALVPGEGPALATAPVEAVPESGQSESRIWLQLGSFRDEDNARRLQRRLREAGVRETEVSRARIDRRTIWRVRVGPLPGAGIAAEIERLARLGFAPATPVRE